MNEIEFSVGVVLYNPSTTELENLKRYLSFSKYVYVFDNSEKSHENEVKNILDERCEYIFDGTNYGISTAYNIMVNRAKTMKQDYLLFMDQDSNVRENEMINAFQIIKNVANPKVAMFCIENEYATSQGNYNAFFNTISFNITSGSIVNVEIFTKLGGYDEEMFIDGVDRDYCLKCLEKGYMILQFKNISMEHKLGTGNSNLLGVFEHSPLRNYYIYRNRLYLIREHKISFKGLSRFRAKELSELKQILSIIFFEKEKIKKLKYINMANRDFKKNVFGKIKKVY